MRPHSTTSRIAFADIQVLRYEVRGWETLSLQQKKLAYYLYEAGLSGRDISMTRSIAMV